MVPASIAADPCRREGAEHDVDGKDPERGCRGEQVGTIPLSVCNDYRDNDSSEQQTKTTASQ
ncbi:hypothetical protein SSBR45G_31630 [Bradyrhizobium sp. SSBR45G]|nr:hypothetical protein SSBR45G_31630 [Bradyrhizobium sp. SSBR45G]GLH85979.1 hypothetical protein SSBR45R_34390 [Bradyrhizobium sp. SSBR45R]